MNSIHTQDMSLIQHARALCCVVFAVLWVLLFPFVLLPLAWSRGSIHSKVRQFLYKIPIYIMGIRIHVKGKYTRHKPALFVSNHASYVDILTLGAAMPASFISKDDVRGWPLIGFIAWLTRTVFIERKPTRAFEELSKIKERISGNEQLLLFPEGTTSDGNTLLPFKTSAFKVAEEMMDGRALHVQPVAVVYSAIDGTPTTPQTRNLVAWYGDSYLLPHVWRLLGYRRVDVTVLLGEPLVIDRPVSRKIIAKECYEHIATMFYGELGVEYAPQVEVLDAA